MRIDGQEQDEDYAYENQFVLNQDDYYKEQMFGDFFNQVFCSRGQQQAQ